MAVINGDSAGNALNGTLYDDTITGYGGNDIINGSGANDTIYGDVSYYSLSIAGADTIDGATGNDFIVGGNQNDSLYGGAGDDTIYGGYVSENSYATDSLYGEDGNDALYGNTGNNNYYGGNGNDDIFDRGATATVDGGQGDDYYYHNVFSGVGGISTITDSGTTSEDVVIISQAATGADLYAVVIGNDLHVRTLSDHNSGIYTKDAVIKDYLTTGIDFVVAANGDPL
jgi:hypothetical protein